MRKQTRKGKAGEDHKGPTAACDALARAQAWIAKGAGGRVRISADEAAELCERIAGRYDEEEEAHDMLRLLAGLYTMFEDGLHGGGDFNQLETALIFGKLRAYMCTQHAHMSLAEFVGLDPKNPRDARALGREYVDDPEKAGAR